jgi:hypothetical protein
MKAYEQIAEIEGLDKIELKSAFEQYCAAVGYSLEEGDKKLFEIPMQAATALLKMYL